MSRNIAVILAGGSGSRFGRDLPKQFLKVAGKKVIEHTIDVFEHNELIDEIAVVTRPEFISDIEQMVVNNHYAKVRKILQGGKERYHSSLSAINAYTNDDDNLIFHDAVRPLVNDRIIIDCIEALKHYDAVDVAIPVADTNAECTEELFYKMLAESRGVVADIIVDKSEIVTIKQKASFAKAMEMGTNIIMGSDAGSANFGPHPSGLVEMLAMEDYGMPKDEVLRRSTIHSAETLGIKNYGAVEPGFTADFVILNKNPLTEGVAAYMNDLEQVFKGGEPV